MSLIHIYLDKKSDSKHKILKLLKNTNINFLEFNLDNDEMTISKYKLNKLPAMKLKNEIIYKINEQTVNELVDKFNSFSDNLQKSNNKFACKILIETIKISNKGNFKKYVKHFTDKHKKSDYII